MAFPFPPIVLAESMSKYTSSTHHDHMQAPVFGTIFNCKYYVLNSKYSVYVCMYVGMYVCIYKTTYMMCFTSVNCSLTATSSRNSLPGGDPQHRRSASPGS